MPRNPSLRMTSLLFVFLMIAPIAGGAPAIPGALYGTDGLNLYLIDKTDGSTVLLGAHIVNPFIAGISFADDGTLYGLSGDDGVGDEADLYTIDCSDGSIVQVGELGIGFVFEGALEFDDGGVLYGADQGSNGNAATFTIDLGDGHGTVVGPNPGDIRDLNGMAFDSSTGTMYALEGLSNTLGTVDLTTGAYTPVHLLDPDLGFAGGLAIDPADGMLYATSSVDGFFSIDKVTGDTVVIADNGVDFGLAFAPLEEPECFLLVGMHKANLAFGNDDVILVRERWRYAVLEDDIPTFTIPGRPRLVGRHVYMQVYMDNPGVFPEDPIQVSNGLDIMLGIGEIPAPYGDNTGIVLWANAPAPVPGTFTVLFDVLGL